MEQENRERLLAYAPIPKGFIKEEPEEPKFGEFEEEWDEQSGALKAYPPIPHGIIKTELQLEDRQDEFNSNVQDVSNATPLVGDADFLQTVPGSAVSLATSNPEMDKMDAGPFMVQRSNDEHREYLVVKEEPQFEESQYEGNANEQNDKQYDERSEHSSLDGVTSTDEEDFILNHSSAGPAQRKKKTARKRMETYYSQEKEKLQFKCKNNCGRAFKAESYLKQHLAKACGIESRFPCKVCGNLFKLKHQLQLHLLRIHNVEKSQLATFGAGPTIRPVLPFKCGQCEKSYKQKSGLSQHLKYDCGMVPSFPCTLCDYKTTRKSNLRIHLTAVHSIDRSQFITFGAAVETRPEQPFKCDKCRRTYKHKQNLNRHLTYECDVNPSFKCNECGYRASQKCTLKQHLINVHASTGLSQLDA